MVANFGLGYEDVISVVSHYVDGALERYSAKAFAEARDRVEELTVNYLRKLRDDAPETLQNAQDPAVQSSLLDAQSAYAKSGDPRLGEVLVNLLARRTESTERGVRQLAISAAIASVDRMSAAHLKLCTAHFFATTVVIAGPTVPDELYLALKATISPFMQNLGASTSDIGYLLDVGVVKADVVLEATPVSQFMKRYPGLFCKGVKEERIPNLDWHIKAGIAGPSPRTPGLIQLNSSNADDLSVRLKGTERESDTGQLASLLLENAMSEEEAFAEMADKVPGFKEFSSLWDRANGLRGFTLTVTGLAVAHANAEAVLGRQLFFQGLETWVS
ncbi:LPO_1073/Vpar_1526 family protein [Streptomyces sp. NPDC002870]|uniref:LPO_1073/Vpar_1526 family protein n=1 Tax=Streptomyces sp. NPDC002870 TaxID=3364666 RepID=UPI00369E91D0